MMPRRYFARLRAGLLAGGALLLLGGAPLRAQNAPTELAAPAPAAFSLEPGDVLKVEVWREKDLSGEFPVDETGTLVLPLLGPQHVLGRPWASLRDELMAAYAQQLCNPSIGLMPLRRVNVLGEVTKPGLYEADPTMTLAEVIGMAGGANPSGDLRRIHIVRGGQVLEQKVEPSRSLGAEDIHSGDQVFVERRGWFDRNSTFVVSMLLSATGIAITLLR